ncbi:MAG: lipopolysaccharide assembly protein LapB [Chromatiaceae bacterium]|nr:MAG: lipopolysaccharide assembly protein LapB [Chromatiaceae bacterium]
MLTWLFLLLPVAAASGWLLARRGERQRGETTCNADPAFFRGLNYLLNEQPDKAIDVFLKLAAVDNDTVETHLALGVLFRRRGEVDRAIRIHQNLVARTSLSSGQRGFALYELGRDYMLAGLFDRAESLFTELLENRLQQKRALRGLIEIYQAEKDWSRCLEMAEKLKLLTDHARADQPIATEIAHYHCELAEDCLRRDDTAPARSHLLAAQSVDPDCIRSTMVQAQMEMAGGDAESALVLYRHLARRGPRYLPAMLPGLLECYRRLGRQQVAAELGELFRAHPSPPLMLELSAAIEREQGAPAALDFLDDYLREHADLVGVERLLDLRLRTAPERARTGDGTLLAVIRHVLALQPAYQCEHCGFEARALHWQCPSCKYWGSIKAVEPDPIADPAVLKQRRIA